MNAHTHTHYIIILRLNINFVSTFQPFNFIQVRAIDPNEIRQKQSELRTIARYSTTRRNTGFHTSTTKLSRRCLLIKGEGSLQSSLPNSSICKVGQPTGKTSGKKSARLLWHGWRMNMAWLSLWDMGHVMQWAAAACTYSRHVGLDLDGAQMWIGSVWQLPAAICQWLSWERNLSFNDFFFLSFKLL